MATSGEILAFPTSRRYESHLELQYFRLPLAEQRKFRKIIRQAAALDRQLAELHLQFPMLEVRHYCLEIDSAESIPPAQLLRWIASWHAARRRSLTPRT